MSRKPYKFEDKPKGENLEICRQIFMEKYIRTK